MNSEYFAEDFQPLSVDLIKCHYEMSRVCSREQERGAIRKLNFPKKPLLIKLPSQEKQLHINVIHINVIYINVKYMYNMVGGQSANMS